MTERRATRGPRWLDALCALVGVLALATAMAVAELVAGFTGPGTVPVVAVGTAVIPLTPEKVKERAIGLFGTSDKTALIIGTCIVVTLIAMVAGIVARRSRTLGNLIVVVLGAVGAVAAITRPTAGMLDVLPSIAAAITGVFVLEALTRRLLALTAARAGEHGGPGETGATSLPDALRRPGRPGRSARTARTARTAHPAGPGAAAAPRRSFLAATGVVAGIAAVSAGIGSVLIGKRYDKAAARAEIVLPDPASPAAPQPPGVQVSRLPDTPPAPTAGASALSSATPSGTATATPTATAGAIPTATATTSATTSATPAAPAATASVPAATASSQAAGTQVSVTGVSPFFTSNDDFYRIDTSILVPELTASTWALRIHGMVRQEVHLTFAELLELPLIERDITLSCVSNDVGGGLISNARWLGALLAPILDRAGVLPGAEQLVSTDVHGMTIGTPVKAVMDGRDALLAVGMNGTTLPFQHGFPVRMVVPGLYGYVSACKWIVDIEVTTWNAYDAYWVQRGWAQQGPIRTESRIDVPRSSVRAGLVPVAGVAWAPHTGISKVEVRVDDGEWNEASLAPVATDDTWREWVYPWLADAGSHQLQVRATNADGVLQTPMEAQPFPSGATGWHTVSVKAS